MQKNNNIEIIVIEDEPDILELIEYHLSKEGYNVTGFLSTERVEQFIEEETPSLMVIDRNLPGIEGSKFVTSLRDLGYELPVMFLTAMDKESDLLEGFRSGGDDYMTKPFSPQELIARVNALLRRSGALTNDKIKYRDLTLELQKHILSIDGTVIDVTNLEFKLLLTFIKNQHQPLDRDFLRDEVWGDDSVYFNDKTINVTMNRLKKKIDPEGEKKYFTSIWGVGYKLV